MVDALLTVLFYIVLCAVPAILTFVLVKLLDYLRRRDAESQAQGIVARASQEVETLRRETDLELKEMAIQAKAEGEKELRKLREELHNRERSLDKRQDALEQQGEQLRKQEKIVESTQRKLTERIQDANRRKEELSKLLDLQRQTLHELSGLSREEATNRLLEVLDKQLQQESGAVILKHEKRMAEACEAKTRELLLTSLQRYAAAHTAETTTSTVDIPNDEMKGRIIGREGRNIRAFEKATGVDVIIDDTPGVVIVSAFDMIRREVARLSLNKLIADGRIHPSRIEEIVADTQRELERHIQRAGEEACQEVDVHGLHERIVNLLGRLQFRTSYSQNVLRHSIEVAFMAGMLADEMGLDGTLARRCGLLHDIGKAADHEAEGGHPKIGADLLKRYGEGREVVHAAAGHHDDAKVEHPFTLLVATADACSASRPGARRETLERYVKRMEELETIATDFPGVEQAFAIQAGREMRVIVNSKDTSDETAAKICRDIVKAFEDRLTFPGEIKVTVLRETRYTEIAR
ncbi:MAG: ribonuclease Y [Planctomycetes bacterium RBG_16_64_12]|nr:MAG: ribonuclease Y [Planctomycetes bacterium RBG_16_64_12]